MTQLAKKKMCDIARLAGVSPSTVSRALNESPLVSENTRERIKTLAKQNNYFINKQAQDLRRQSSNTISILTPDTSKSSKAGSDPFAMELIDAIANQLSKAGYELLLSRIQPDNWQRHIMAHNYVDGIIILGQSEKQDKLDYLNHLHTPTIVWGDIGQDDCTSVSSNNICGGKLAGQHMLNQGRKNLVFLGDTSKPEIEQRYSGLCQVFQEAGLNKPIKASATTSSEYEFKANLDELIRKKVYFDGIFAANDLIAARTIKYLTKLGISVPEQVSVIGYGNTQLSELMCPAISTVSQNISLAAKTLVDLLLQQIEGQEVSDILLQPKLVVRES